MKGKTEEKNGHTFWHSLFCQDCGIDIRESDTKKCEPAKKVVAQ